MCCKVEANDERIDVERLKVRDKISFYSDVMLFEDELHDSGCSVLSVKIVCCITNSKISFPVLIMLLSTKKLLGHTTLHPYWLPSLVLVSC